MSISLTVGSVTAYDFAVPDTIVCIGDRLEAGLESALVDQISPKLTRENFSECIWSATRGMEFTLEELRRFVDEFGFESYSSLADEVRDSRMTEKLSGGEGTVVLEGNVFLQMTGKDAPQLLYRTGTGQITGTMYGDMQCALNEMLRVILKAMSIKMKNCPRKYHPEGFIEVINKRRRAASELAARQMRMIILSGKSLITCNATLVVCFDVHGCRRYRSFSGFDTDLDPFQYRVTAPLVRFSGNFHSAVVGTSVLDRWKFNRLMRRMRDEDPFLILDEKGEPYLIISKERLTSCGRCPDFAERINELCLGR